MGSGRRHYAIVARLEEFLEANLDRPLYLAEICPAIGVAERTLRIACEERLGIRSATSPCEECTLSAAHSCAPIHLRPPSLELLPITASGN